MCRVEPETSAHLFHTKFTTKIARHGKNRPVIYCEGKTYQVTNEYSCMCMYGTRLQCLHITIADAIDTNFCYMFESLDVVCIF